MAESKITRRKLLMATPIVATCGLAASAIAQDPRSNLREPVYRVSNNNKNETNTQQVAAVQEHPLTPAVQLAQRGLERMNAIKDYQCTLVKREQVNGTLQQQEFIFTKIRHEQKDAAGKVTVPFSVYMYFVAPSNVKGREVMYVKGHNDGKLTAHEGGNLLRLITVSLDPNSALAMRGNRYPITEVGIKNLVTRLIEVAKMDMKYGECTVNFFNGAKVQDRVCTVIEVIHPVPRKNFRFHKVHIFIDDEMQVPIRFVSYEWAKDSKGNPKMLEEYTYMNMKLNNGFTDKDFDVNNPNYNF